MGKLSVVGIGPGAYEYMTIIAKRTLEEAEVIVGYTGYIDLIQDLISGKDIVSTGMGAEKERCQKALEIASSGKNTALVCSGDAVVYGMAGLVYELSSDYPDAEIEVIPGITAAISGSALLGAGVGNDFAVISLSNYLTEKEDTYKRLEMCAKGDMVMALYNPSSKARPDCLREACQHLLNFIEPGRVCGIARNIGRNDEQCQVMTLKELVDADTDMFSTVFIGSSKTANLDGKFVTKRGYSL